MGKSVMNAAEAVSGRVIGVDVDQSAISKTVVTSAKKNLTAYVQRVLNRYNNNRFVGGMTEHLTARQKFVGLEMVNSRFRSYNRADHELLLAKMREDGFRILTDRDVKSVTELPLELAEVQWIDQKIQLLGRDDIVEKEKASQRDAD